MKGQQAIQFTGISVMVILALSIQSNAFHVTTTSQKMQQTSTTRLELSKSVWGSVASAILGVTLASQVASAGNFETRSPFYEMPTTIAAVETLDFSLPSYGDSIKGDVKAKKDIPNFNPFGDFQPDFVKPDTSADDDNKAALKAAAEAKKSEDKAAAEARRAEERAARDAKRLKQLEESERVEATPAAPSIPLIPEFKAPEFKAPDFAIPDFKAPDLPTFSMPKVDFDSSKVEMPKVDMPKMDMPKIELPSFSIPSFGGSSTPSTATPKQFSPQEVRDEAARQARQEYLKFDDMAKEVEAQARAARGVANEKLSDAKVAKDLACETRPGGKILCLRNPFSSGF